MFVHLQHQTNKQLKNKIMTTLNNFTRFNKSVLNTELKNQILDLISDRDFKEFKNELFGLFDGYLYNSIEYIADTDLCVWKKRKLKLITLTIKGYNKIGA